METNALGRGVVCEVGSGALVCRCNLRYVEMEGMGMKKGLKIDGSVVREFIDLVDCHDEMLSSKRHVHALFSLSFRPTPELQIS